MGRVSLERSPLCLAQWSLVLGSGWFESSGLTFMYGTDHDTKLWHFFCVRN